MATKKVALPGQQKLKDLKRELFCILYAGGGGHYFGNASRCYLHAYGGEEEIDKISGEVDKTYSMPGSKGDDERRRLKNRQKSLEGTARRAGSRLMTKVDILNRTNYLLDRYLSDDYADREMAYVITQRTDLMAKVAAYREVAKVKERIRGAGALSGEFEFTWDDGTGTKEKPATKKTVKVKAAVASDGEMMADFS